MMSFVGLSAVGEAPSQTISWQVGELMVPESTEQYDVSTPAFSHVSMSLLSSESSPKSTVDGIAIECFEGEAGVARKNEEVYGP